MSGKSELVKLRVSTDEKLLWEKAAGVMTLSAWMRESCNTAARIGSPEVDNRTVSAGQREVRGDKAEVVSVPPGHLYGVTCDGQGGEGCAEGVVSASA
jgi:hypothetical protein